MKFRKNNKPVVEKHTTEEDQPKRTKKKFSEMDKQEKIKVAVKSTIMIAILLGFMIFFFIMAFFPQLVTHPNMSAELNIAEAYNPDTTSQGVATAQSDNVFDTPYNEQLMPKNGLGTSRSDDAFWVQLDSGLTPIGNGWVEVVSNYNSNWINMYCNDLIGLKTNTNYKIMLETDCFDDSSFKFVLGTNTQNVQTIFNYKYIDVMGSNKYFIDVKSYADLTNDFFRFFIDKDYGNRSIFVGDKFRLSIFEEDNPRTTYTPNLNYLVEQEKNKTEYELVNLHNDLDFNGVDYTDRVYLKDKDEKINAKRVYNIHRSFEPDDAEQNNIYKLDCDYLSDNGLDLDFAYDYFYPLVKSEYVFDKNFLDVDVLGFGILIGSWVTTSSEYNPDDGYYYGFKLVLLDVVEGSSIIEPSEFIYEEYASKEFHSTSGWGYFDDIDMYLDWSDNINSGDKIKLNSHKLYKEEHPELNQVNNVPELYNFFLPDVFVGGSTSSDIYDTAYKQGYNDSIANGTAFNASMSNTIFSIINAPVDVIKNIFNFEFFGVNISGLIMFIVSVVLVGIVVKKIRGL